MEYLTFDEQVIVEKSCRFIIETLERFSEMTDKDMIIGLSGGSSPKPLYTLLNETMPKDIISRLVFIQIDERITNVENNDSNQKLITSTMSDLLIKGASFYPMPVDIDVHTQEGCLSYEKQIQELFEKSYPCIALLGVGEDGHTASIFPDHKDEIPTDERFVFLTPREKNGYYRMSLSAYAIDQMKIAIMYSPGQKKKHIISHIINKDTMSLYPAAEILHNHQESYLITGC